MSSALSNLEAFVESAAAEAEQVPTIRKRQGPGHHRRIWTQIAESVRTEKFQPRAPDELYTSLSAAEIKARWRRQTELEAAASQKKKPALSVQAELQKLQRMTEQDEHSTQTAHTLYDTQYARGAQNKQPMPGIQNQATVFAAYASFANEFPIPQLTERELQDLASMPLPDILELTSPPPTQ